MLSSAGQSDWTSGGTSDSTGHFRRPTIDLTGGRRTRALAPADTAVRDKPPTADAAGPLREHPEMLA